MSVNINNIQNKEINIYMQNNIKAMRFEIIKPMEMEWEDFKKILYDLRYETRAVLNKSLQYCWEYEGFSSDYKSKFDNYPKPQDVIGYKMIFGYIYSKISKDFTKPQTSSLSQTIKRATDKWKLDKKHILVGDKSIASFRKDIPIDIVSKSIKIYNEDSKYQANLSLLSTEYRKKLDLKSGQIMVQLKAGDGTQKAILDRLIKGEYKLCASQILQSKNKWFLNITYQFESQPKDLDKNRILGVDLGIVNTATYQVFDSTKENYEFIKGGCYISGQEILHFRRKMAQRNKELGRASKWAGEGRVGHGRNTRMKPAWKIGDKVARFKDDYNHKVSKHLVDIALKNQCGVIQMENLSGFDGKGESMLEEWAYYDLQTKLEYKAQEHGIEVKLINPRFTSQRCSKCGHIHTDNRQKQSEFKCVQCGFEKNADLNAARNIAIPHIDEIITQKAIELGLIQVDEDGKEKTKKSKKSVKKLVNISNFKIN